MVDLTHAESKGDKIAPYGMLRVIVKGEDSVDTMRRLSYYQLAFKPFCCCRKIINRV